MSFRRDLNNKEKYLSMSLLPKPCFTQSIFPSSIISTDFSYSLDVLVMNSFSFFISENGFISSLFLKGIFSGYIILGWRFFSGNLKMWLHCLLTHINSYEKSVPLIFCASLILNNLIIWYLVYFFFLDFTCKIYFLK